MAKKKNSLFKNIALGVLVVALVGGAAVGTTMLVKNWDKIFNKEEVDPVTELESYRMIDFTKNDKNGVALTGEGLVTYFNSFTTKGTPVAESIGEFVAAGEGSRDAIENVYRSFIENEGSLKLGSASKDGSFRLNLISTYTYNKLRITARSYSALNETTLIYSCDNSTLSSPNSPDDAMVLPTNAVDNTKRADILTNTFTMYAEDSEIFITANKRVDIYKIELWNSTELPAPAVEA